MSTFHIDYAELEQRTLAYIGRQTEAAELTALLDRAMRQPMTIMHTDPAIGLDVGQTICLQGTRGKNLATIVAMPMGQIELEVQEYHPRPYALPDPAACYEPCADNDPRQTPAHRERRLQLEKLARRRAR